MTNNYIKGATGDWEIVIGLEIHAQVTSNSKLFSGSSTKFGAEPNTQVSLVDAAMPGMLPVLNEFCVAQAVKTGLAINAKINNRSVFDRKNYFYADLPQGYQISQYRDPIVGEGSIEIEMPYGKKLVGIERIHLEQDAGKSMHDQSPEFSFIDLNRSGVALMEIVTKPDLRSAEEAGEFLKKLRTILRYIETCDGDMEKGSMRCDANVSVRKPGAEFGTRNEIKNLNSIKNVITAINFEARRQIDLIESGGTVSQATRLFDANSLTTRVMRDKENAHDYRYFPDPDLYPLVLSNEFIKSINDNLPELPDQKKDRYINQLGLNEAEALVIIADKTYANYFEELIKYAEAKLSSNWLTAELFGRLNKLGIDFDNCPISPANFGELLSLITNNTISGKIAKDVLDFMFETGKKAPEIIEEKGLKQVTDNSAIEAVIKKILETNPDKVAEYKSGKDKLFGFFVGQVMKEMQGKGNPQIINDLLKQHLA